MAQHTLRSNVLACQSVRIIAHHTNRQICMKYYTEKVRMFPVSFDAEGVITERDLLI
jgi:hypothetical protein